MAVNLDTIAEKIMKFIRGNGLEVKMFDSKSGKSVALTLAFPAAS